MILSKSNVLITGAGGFIGSHLAEKLVEKVASVKAFIHYSSSGSNGWLENSEQSDDIQIFSGDIRDQDSLKKALEGVDIVFHLAALIAIPYSYISPSAYVRTNVEGTLNILQVAMEKGISKLIHTSTSEVYGSARFVPINEDHQLQGQSPYSASKIGADKIAESFFCAFGYPVVTVRPFNTYGPRQSARAVIPTIISQALTQKRITLGNISPTRDLTYVYDTVDGFIKCAQTEGIDGEVINLGVGKDISIGELADTILNVMGLKIPVVSEENRLRPSKSEVSRLCSDNSKARRLLGWEPVFSLKTGLTETIDWVKNNIDKYRPNEYTI